MISYTNPLSARGRRSMPLALLPALLALTACGVTCDHPLSDEETSVIDERLIGRWEAVDEDLVGAPDPEAPDTAAAERILVGRREGAQNTLEAVWTELDHEGFVQVRRVLVFATKMGGRRFLSATGADAEAKRYMLFAYEPEGPGTLRLFGLNEEVVKQAIAAGHLPGTVEKKATEGDVSVPYEEVCVTAATDVLRAWVEKHAAKAFHWEKPGTLRRVGAASGRPPEGDGAPHEEHDAEDDE